MSKADYDNVKAYYEDIERQQSHCCYRLKAFLSTCFPLRFFCCCCGVQDKLNVEFDELTPIQKKYRVKNYWRKARLVFHFVRMKNLAQISNKKRKQEGTDADNDVDMEYVNRSSESEWRWYIIRSENTFPQIWAFLLNNLTVYAMFATPLVLVFPAFSDSLRTFEIFVDVCFTIEICCNFYRLEEGQSLSHLVDNRLEYIDPLRGGTFYFDCAAALPGLITLEQGNLNWTKLARFIHWERFFKQLNLIFEKVFMSWFGYTKQMITEYVDLLKLNLAVILVTHLMACVWIAIGIYDDEGWVNTFLISMTTDSGYVPQP